MEGVNREMGQENLTGPEIAAVWIGSLLALAGFINTLGAAWEKLHKAIGAAKAPDRRTLTLLARNPQR